MLNSFAVGEFVTSKSGKQKLADYRNNLDYCIALRTIFMSAFGENIELLVTGGAAMAFDLEDLMAQKLQIPFVTGYGMTEACPTIAIGEKGKYKMKSVGEIVAEGIECRIESSDPEHIPGELIIRGDCVFTGYYKNPEATAEVIDANGYLHSGDLGVKDEQGFYKITGRIKDMIIRGGENIYPREIEEFLYHMPGIRDVQVAAVPSKKYGEAVGAFIILEEGVKMEPEDVQEFCRGKIARYKIPKYVFFIDQFPLTGSGKIQKFKLKEMSLDLCKKFGYEVI